MAQSITRNNPFFEKALANRGNHTHTFGDGGKISFTLKPEINPTSGDMTHLTWTIRLDPPSGSGDRMSFEGNEYFPYNGQPPTVTLLEMFDPRHTTTYRGRQKDKRGIVENLLGKLTPRKVYGTGDVIRIFKDTRSRMLQDGATQTPTKPSQNSGHRNLGIVRHTYRPPTP